MGSDRPVAAPFGKKAAKMSPLSIIIPSRPDEPALAGLLAQLEGDARAREILVMSEGSRAASLNAGARKATGSLLWFLHADSRLAPDTLDALLSAHSRDHGALHFFDLRFDAEAGPLVRLNQAGANARARLLGVPFGDQGLACSQAVYGRVGGFDEGLAYGEDHVFVWRARQAGIPLDRIGAAVLTSSRRYKQAGWARLTLLYQYRWIAQALPEAMKLLRSRSAQARRWLLDRINPGARA